jgi:hypothetical protein
MAEHVRQAIEDEAGSKATTTLDWLQKSAMADLCLVRVAHEVLRVFTREILEKAFRSVLSHTRPLSDA